MLKGESSGLFRVLVGMCYQIFELYSACRCLYYQHAVDRCAAFDRPGHSITRKTILVGYACANHSEQSYDEPSGSASTTGDYNVTRPTLKQAAPEVRQRERSVPFGRAVAEQSGGDHLMPLIGANLQVHFFGHQTHAGMPTALYQQVTTKLRKELKPCSQSGSLLGWDITLMESVETFIFFLYGGAVFIVWLMATIVWADSQDGFDISAFVWHSSSFVVVVVGGGGGGGGGLVYSLVTTTWKLDT